MSNKRSQSSHHIPPDLIFFSIEVNLKLKQNKKFIQKKLFPDLQRGSGATKMKNADELKMDGKFYDQIDLYICSKEEK